MTQVDSVMMWWILFSVGVAMLARFPYCVFRSSPVLTTTLSIAIGPAFWMIAVIYWIRSHYENR